MQPGEDFDDFCRREYGRLVAALTRHTGEAFLAEELAHEALIRAGDRWSRVGQLDAPVGWCFHVGVNLARSVFRRRGAERRARARLGAQRAPAPFAADDAEPELAAALSGLPDPQRKAVVMRHVLGMTPAEMAATCGTTEEAIRARTSRGLRTLRVELGAATTQQGAVDA